MTTRIICLVGLLTWSVFCFGCDETSASGGDPLSRTERLERAQTFMYQLQDLDVPGAVDVLDDTDYPMLVLEPGHNHVDDPWDTAAIVEALAEGRDGEPRLLLAYIDIGQAENWRDYWQDDWVEPTADAPGEPDFLITIDPDNWAGNFPVAYWDARWQALWLGPEGIVAELARLGFDGIYLDWVEAYDDDKVAAAARDAGVDAADAMIDFIEALQEAGEAVSEGFLVVPQNAPYLIDHDEARYVEIIDALAVEDTWYHGDGDADWDDPRAGDLHERHDGMWSTEARLAQYQVYLDHDLPVFTVDYCVDEDNAAEVYRAARAAGLRPLVTRVSLSRLTETPPWDD